MIVQKYNFHSFNLSTIDTLLQQYDFDFTISSNQSNMIQKESMLILILQAKLHRD